MLGFLCNIYNLTKYREDEALCDFINIYENKSSIRLLGSKIYGRQRGFIIKWLKRLVTTGSQGSKQTTWNTKSRSTNHESFREDILQCYNECKHNTARSVPKNSGVKSARNCRV
ncbi:hypothetical protein V8G54_037185 [Vigna mungo]|uniref:Uncharacterized protein n=1 Tax=Vigna mungo TaxID=3915 RepID=A0AAQ3MIP1_VIGMU